MAELPATRGKDGRLFPLHESTLRVSDAQTWLVRLPAQYAFSDIVEPDLWKKIALQNNDRSGRPKVNDFVRVIGDGFDCVFVIESAAGSYALRFHHGRLPDEQPE
jgi:hypothetical protein